MNLETKIRELTESQLPVQLHLGSGKKFIPGFLHIDRDPYDHIDLVSSINQLPMIDDNSVDLIYCCHALEYFDQFEVPKVLTEWNRILKPGGTLRISVPDLDKVIKIYTDGTSIKQCYSFIYGRYHKADTGNTPIYHRIIFNEPILKQYLADSNFTNFRHYDWRQTIHKDYDDYSQAYIPHMDKENGLLMSLNVEADKI